MNTYDKVLNSTTESENMKVDANTEVKMKVDANINSVDNDNVGTNEIQTQI